MTRRHRHRRGDHRPERVAAAVLALAVGGLGLAALIEHNTVPAPTEPGPASPSLHWAEPPTTEETQTWAMPDTTTGSPASPQPSSTDSVAQPGRPVNNSMRLAAR